MADSMYGDMQCEDCGYKTIEWKFEQHSFIDFGWAGCEYECPKCKSDNVEQV